MQLALEIDPLPVETPEVVFDLSRLLRQRRRAFGTGVDRIDLAIGLDLAARFGDRCAFVRAGPFWPVAVAPRVGRDFLEALASRWGGARQPLRPGRRILLAGLAGPAVAPTPDETTYVVASHSGLPLRRGALGRIDPSRRLRRLVYIHDLIPLDFPEYQRPKTRLLFETFLEQVSDGPLALAANSADTARRLGALAAERGWSVGPASVLRPRIRHGRPAAGTVQERPVRAAVEALATDRRPFFLCVGTIEPRKNHLLLLHLWRALADRSEPPRLVIAGGRGWENEQVVDMLERCQAIRSHVIEFNDLSDPEVARLVRGARALLMPSFAEGLGIPVIEAAALGTQAIVSDLPALREIAAPGTLFLDPLDGPAWLRAILDCAGR